MMVLRHLKLILYKNQLASFAFAKYSQIIKDCQDNE